MDFILQPWPWYVAGPLVALIMLVLLLVGKNFGMSSNLRTMCSIGGAGKFSDFFNFDWKNQIWNLTIVAGAIIGGAIAHHFLSIDNTIDLNESTVESLKTLGFENPGGEYIPKEIFGLSALTSFPNILILIAAGLMVGFGARYAGGCTSGHAISGLSDLQLPSLIAVIGFFIGGLIMTHLILPFIF